MAQVVAAALAATTADVVEPVVREQVAPVPPVVIAARAVLVVVTRVLPARVPLLARQLRAQAVAVDRMCRRGRWFRSTTTL